MEGLFSASYLENEAHTLWMFKIYQQKMQSIARTAHLVRLATANQSAWYCPLLIYMGEALIAFGTRLKAHYSIHPAFHSRSAG